MFRYHCGCRLYLLALAAGFSCWQRLLALAADFGCRFWLQTLAANLGCRPWLQTLAADFGFIPNFFIKMKIRASNTKSPIVYIIEADLHQDINKFSRCHIYSGLSRVRTITLRVISCAKVWESLWLQTLPAGFGCWQRLLSLAADIGCRLWL